MSVVASRRKPQRLAPKTDEIVAAIFANHGFLAPAAKALGLSRSSLDRMVQRRGKLAMACRQSRETLVDFTEGKLFECISEKKERSIIFALSTLGRHRGYALAKGTELNLGDTSALQIGSVTIQSIPSGKFVDDDPSAIEGSIDGKIADHHPTKKLE